MSSTHGLLPVYRVPAAPRRPAPRRFATVTQPPPALRNIHWESDSEAEPEREAKPELGAKSGPVPTAKSQAPAAPEPRPAWLTGDEEKDAERLRTCLERDEHFIANFRQGIYPTSLWEQASQGSKEAEAKLIRFMGPEVIRKRREMEDLFAPGGLGRWMKRRELLRQQELLQEEEKENLPPAQAPQPERCVPEPSRATWQPYVDGDSDAEDDGNA
ncbi:hypothetical protein MKEN_01144900 [Mycena kentingensis (nom. inval.)]|nr:hypothetical protein MKEN_01144900 [Mycena kentingensis (nom. inval.)]